MSDEKKVTRLPTPHKGAADGHFLVVREPRYPHCYHLGPYIVDGALATVECRNCGEKLNPMFVLEKLMHKETMWHRVRDAYQDEMKRLTERTSTKCKHCGKMTRISNK